MVDTLFPSLHGDSPGDLGAMQGEDITGPTLPPLVEKPDPFKDSFTSSGPSASSYASRHDQEGMPPVSQPRSIEPMDEEPSPQEGAGKNRRTARERISQLTRRYRQAEDRADGLSQTVNQLTAQIRKQEEQLQQLSQRPVQQAPTTDMSYGDYGSTQVQTPQVGVGDIRRAVEEAIAPIRAQQEQMAQETRLQQEQQLSYGDALQELPALNDPNSEESAAFREIWSGSPLRSYPDGPLHVALQVKGAFAEERLQQPVREARKRAASVVSPGPAPDVTQQPQTRTRQMRQVFDSAMDRFKSGDESGDTYIAARKAQRRLQQ